MGVVYLARKVALNRPCALKMILAGAHAGQAAAARFRVEAEAVARLRHPGIVQIYHVGEADGLPFLELEYLPGGSLEKAIDGTPRPAAEAARLVEALARAIAEAHRQGIVHRDLKPANILLDAGGHPKVADFGLAKILDSEDGLTRTHLVLGSPSYMAPEQADGGCPRRRHDGRRLRPGRHPLRAADRPAAVPGGDGAGDPGAGQGHRAGPAVAAPAGPAARRRDDLPEVPGEGPSPAIRDGRGAGRGPAPLPGRRADPGAARIHPGAGLEVGPAAARRRGSRHRSPWPPSVLLLGGGLHYNAGSGITTHGSRPPPTRPGRPSSRRRPVPGPPSRSGTWRSRRSAS